MVQKTIVEIDDLVKLHKYWHTFIDYAQWLQTKWWSIYEKQTKYSIMNTTDYNTE